MEAQGPEPGYQNRIDGGLTGTLSRENLHERAHSALRDDKVWASVDSVGQGVGPPNIRIVLHGQYRKLNGRAGRVQARGQGRHGAGRIARRMHGVRKTESSEAGGDMATQWMGECTCRCG